ncbi:MAG: TolC family protein [Tannerella sp.]|jgi:cobalt-zinc-cadmium efflux system outer membrane protein|nr:TolC family protein [Tannerella sp.]
MGKKYIAAILIGLAYTANAQRVLTYDTYMKNVREKNVEYIVEKYNLSIAEANTQAAKVMPDPEISFGYENNQDKTMQMGQAYAAELGYTLELGGKRSARMAVARSEQQMTGALVEDFFRNLRADATLCYLDALKQKQLVALALSSYESMRELARGDSLRLALGEIAEVDALQTRLEATTMMTGYLQAEADYQDMLSDLMVFEGGVADVETGQGADVGMLHEGTLNAEELHAGTLHGETLHAETLHATSLQGELRVIQRVYNLQNLIELAQENRADLRTAILNRELSAANVRLAKANRVIDLGLNIGFTHNTIVLNEIAPAPRHNSFAAGISIPLKFSNANKGELRAAQFSEQQAKAQYDAVLLQIRKEVEQCYNRYTSACRQAEEYQNSALTNAATILEKKKFSYARGETSLLEVLDAQRTANEVFRAYYEALFNANASLVELCRSVGIWENVFAFL